MLLCRGHVSIVWRYAQKCISLLTLGLGFVMGICMFSGDKEMGGVYVVWSIS